MNTFALPFFPGILSFAVFAMVLPLAMRWDWPSSPALRLLPVAIVVFPASILAGWYWLGIFAPWHSAAIFGLLFMVLWFAFGSIGKSVTLLVSCHLRADADGVATADIKSDVIEGEFNTRAALLTEIGYAHFEEGKYAITPAGQNFLRKLRWASSLFGIKSEGLYGFDR